MKTKYKSTAKDMNWTKNKKKEKKMAVTEARMTTMAKRTERVVSVC